MFTSLHHIFFFIITLTFTLTITCTLTIANPNPITPIDDHAHAHIIYYNNEQIAVDTAERRFYLQSLAVTPLKGWNSYDSFDWYVNETAFRANVDYIAENLSEYGYNIVVVDFYWYTSSDQSTTSIDTYGRLQPDPQRWPSSQDGSGFKTIADYVHSKGLLFGIHTMRGISETAINTNAPVYNTSYSAKDVTDFSRECGWSFNTEKFYAVNISHPAGQAFYDSLYSQYAVWGVDFIKNDCVYGADFQLDQITAVSDAIHNSVRMMLLSLSPGTSNNPYLASQVHSMVNMYRITGDTWDNWDNLYQHFSAAGSLQGFVGVSGRDGALSWPDLDMLPLGYISSPGGKEPTHFSSLTKDEQTTMISLWCMFRSPLFYGGDLRNPDPFSLSLITNKEALQIHQSSMNNRYIFLTKTSAIWTAQSVNVREDGMMWLSYHNLNNTVMTFGLDVVEISPNGEISCAVRDLWDAHDYGQAPRIVATVQPHASFVFTLSNCTNSPSSHEVLKINKQFEHLAENHVMIL